MLQVSEVIVQVAWVWEHRSTSMAPPPCMDDDNVDNAFLILVSPQRGPIYILVDMASHDIVQQRAASDIPAISVTTIQVRVYLVTV